MSQHLPVSTSKPINGGSEESDRRVQTPVRPESPISRKRTEVKDDDEGHYTNEEGVSTGTLEEEMLPPFKKSKTSPPMVPVNNHAGSAAFRSPTMQPLKPRVTGGGAGDDSSDGFISPTQTSPILNPAAPRLVRTPTPSSSVGSGIHQQQPPQPHQQHQQHNDNSTDTTSTPIGNASGTLLASSFPTATDRTPSTPTNNSSSNTVSLNTNNNNTPHNTHTTTVSSSSSPANPNTIGANTISNVLSRVRPMDATMPALTRKGSTLLELKNSSEAFIEGLSLGGPGEKHTGRAASTTTKPNSRPTSQQNSRQNSPAVVSGAQGPTARTMDASASHTVTMRSRESTPQRVIEHMLVDDHLSLHGPDTLSSLPTEVAMAVPSPSPSDLTSSSDDSRIHTSRLFDTSVDYDEEADVDYKHVEMADTGEESEGDTDEGLDDSHDEFEFHLDNGFERDLSEDLYVDVDPLSVDRFSDEEAAAIIYELREEGVSHVIQHYIMNDIATLKKLLLVFEPDMKRIPPHVTQSDLLLYLQGAMRECTHRQRLKNITSIEKVVDLLQNSKRIMVLTGAGVSVSCGIPDFRSEDGIYSRLSEFQLDDPQQMFDLEFFNERPEIFYSFAKEIFPSNFMPSPSHYFIRLLEEKGKLLRNYTQNIDTLEQKAGIKNVLQCHGSFATASCLRCKRQVPGEEIKDSIFKQEVAYCKYCTKAPSPKPRPSKKGKKNRRFDSDDDESSEEEDEIQALMKPDIVFFGEKLPNTFDECLHEDRDKVDMLIVMGSSLKVAPVSDIMSRLPSDVPQILINRTPIIHMNFDVQLLGNCDTIVAELCRMTGWELKHEKLPGGTSNVQPMDLQPSGAGSSSKPVKAFSHIEPNTYIFEGAVFQATNDFAKGRKRGRLDTDDMSEDGIGSSADESFRRRQISRGSDYTGSGHRHQGAVNTSGHLGSLLEDDDDDDEDENDDLDSDSETSDQSQETVHGPPGHMPDSGDISFRLSQDQSKLLNQQGSNSSSGSQQSQSFGHVHGMAVGTTEPHSGSIGDIHHSGQDEFESRQHQSFTSTSSQPQPPESDMYDDGEDEEEAKIRILFTEKMPRDLGEEADDTEPIVGHHHDLEHHKEKKLSIDPELMPVVESEQGEEDEDVDVDVDVVGKEEEKASGRSFVSLSPASASASTAAGSSTRVADDEDADVMS